MALGSGVTVRGAVAQGERRLALAGCETPRLDAEVLLAYVLGVDRARLVIAGHEPLAGEASDRFEALLARREVREPVAYLTGCKEFRRLTLAVDRRVLIPRPETELLVEVGIGLAHGAAVLEVGTGSGAVALALKDERPDLEVMGSDLDPDALEVARANARRLGLEVEFFKADLLEGLPRRYDAVLANLPYVADDGAEIAPEVAGYEPRSALFAGPDGLAAIRRLVRMAVEIDCGETADIPVKPQFGRISVLALEVGWDQAAAVSSLLYESGFSSVERLRDLAGHERVVVGRR